MLDRLIRGDGKDKKGNADSLDLPERKGKLGWEVNSMPASFQEGRGEKGKKTNTKVDLLPDASLR